MDGGKKPQGQISDKWSDGDGEIVRGDTTEAVQEEKEAMSQSPAQSLTLLIGRPSIARTVAATVDVVTAGDTTDYRKKEK